MQSSHLPEGWLARTMSAYRSGEWWASHVFMRSLRRFWRWTSTVFEWFYLPEDCCPNLVSFPALRQCCASLVYIPLRREHSMRGVSELLGGVICTVATGIGIHGMISQFDMFGRETKPPCPGHQNLQLAVNFEQMTHERQNKLRAWGIWDDPMKIYLPYSTPSFRDESSQEKTDAILHPPAMKHGVLENLPFRSMILSAMNAIYRVFPRPTLFDTGWSY